MPEGMLCSVYRLALGDCSLNGITSREKSLRVIGPGATGPFGDKPDLVLVPSHGHDGWRAVPFAHAAHVLEHERRAVALRGDTLRYNIRLFVTWADVHPDIDWPEPDRRWHMDGGNLIGTSDSRWKHGYIEVHDRVEPPGSRYGD